MGKTKELLKFLIHNKITIKEAIELLQEADRILMAKVAKAQKEKAVLEKYETREDT
jgi:hypothetical protein